MASNKSALAYVIAFFAWTAMVCNLIAQPAWEDNDGFTQLFNGRDLTGWKGLVGDPKSRKSMGARELAVEQAKADGEMRAHWKVRDGVLCFDGHGSNLCTEKEYSDFMLLVDFKIQKSGDSGVYLRGSPQVQIWDPNLYDIGSGGLYNNKSNPSTPLVAADHPVGSWNSLKIEMIDDKVSVWLNDRVVVHKVTLENYWEPDKPIYSSGPIELQSHDTPLYFRNIFIKELP